LIARLAGRTELAGPGGGLAATRFDAVTLTDDGAAVLGGVYQADAPADPVTIRPVNELLSAPARIL
jgi:hypothetical protein